MKKFLVTIEFKGERSEEGHMTNECYFCKHMRRIPGNSHISCMNPDKNMTGLQRGIEMRWFYYPVIYDPVWKAKMCDNYEESAQKT